MLTSSSIFVIGENNLTEYLQTTFKDHADLIPTIRAAYPNVIPNATSDYDVISAIYGDLAFLCVRILIVYQLSSS